MGKQDESVKVKPIINSASFKNPSQMFKAGVFSAKKMGKGGAVGFDPARFKTQHKG